MSLRVFVSPGADRLAPLSPEESHYLVRVRRARAGQPIEALDGAGGRWRAVVRAADARAARVELLEPVPSPPTAQRVVLLGMPDRAPLLTALDHALCLGASRVVLLHCERGAEAPPNQTRIDRTLRAAMRQSGRPTPMPVEGPLPLDRALAAAPGRRYVASPEAAPSPPLPATAADTATASVLVGPEGGLCPQELQLARRCGFLPLGLGPWILRSPLAVAAALSRLVPCAPDAGA